MIKLTNKQIVDAFPDECETLVPKLLRSRRRKMQEISNHISNIYIHHNEIACILVVVWQQAGELIEKDIRRLKNLNFTKRNIKRTIEHPDRKPSIDVDQARNVPIETIHNFENMRKSRYRIQCSCPLHTDSSPSMTIYTQSNTFHCFSCQAGSSSIDLVMQLNDLSFVDAVRYLNEL